MAPALRIACGCLLASLSLIIPPRATAAEMAPARVGTVTRLVKLFREKEAALASALRSGDTGALDSLLADDFELRTSADPASPVPRAQWIEEMRARDAGGDVRGMAVHDFGGVAVASFLEESKAGAAFVVDVWRGSATQWKLQVRYASPVARGAAGLTPPKDSPTGR